MKSRLPLLLSVLSSTSLWWSGCAPGTADAPPVSPDGLPSDSGVDPAGPTRTGGIESPSAPGANPTVPAPAGDAAVNATRPTGGAGASAANPDAGPASNSVKTDAALATTDGAVAPAAATDLYEKMHKAEAAIFATLPAGPAQLALVCGRGNTDAVTKALCATPTPTITSLVELQRALGLEIGAPAGTTQPTTAQPLLAEEPAEEDLSGFYGNHPKPPPTVPPGVHFSLTGYTPSLAARSVSQINPHLVLFRGNTVEKPMVTIGYARGEQTVEIIAWDTKRKALNFYVVRYEQGCNATGCTPGHLLTAETEKGFTGWTLYDEANLENTIFACSRCHQPAGPTGEKILLFQQLQSPWTHWFIDVPPNRALITDYTAAHGTAGYGGVPGALIKKSAPDKLETLIRVMGFAGKQPLLFSPRIEQEVIASKMIPGVSATWEKLFQEKVLTGKVPPLAYHDMRPTDPAKLKRMTELTRGVVDGKLPRSALPDIRDVFLDAGLDRMSFRPRANATAREVLTHMCGSCHNSKVDPVLSRARFNVEQLDTMPKAMKTLALVRMKLPHDSPMLMPPLRAATLSPEAISLVEAELNK